MATYIHDAYLIIEAVIDVPWQRERMPDAAGDFFISPASIAAQGHHLAHQPRDAWSFLAEVRRYHVGSGRVLSSVPHRKVPVMPANWLFGSAWPRFREILLRPNDRDAMRLLPGFIH